MSLQKLCTNCSSTNLNYAKFCSNCGMALQLHDADDVNVAQKDPGSPRSKNNWGRYFQIILAVFLIGAFGAYFISLNYSPSPNLNYETSNSENQSYESGQRSCKFAGQATANGQYVCLGGYWVEQQVQVTEPQPQGRWVTNCINVKVPNPNYDARKGYSAIVNEPYINQEQCNQQYVYE
jgi:hypothetical protein